MTARQSKPRNPPRPAAPAELASMPVRHPPAAGIDVGDRTHWVCVDSTPDGSDTVREFPAPTQGPRDLVAWLRGCGGTPVALEASGAYGHVPFPTLIEAGLAVVMTAPAFTRPIQGRPQTDRRDCQGIQRLHKHGLLPAVFRPDAAPRTLGGYVRQRANLVRLRGQHVQRLQKALERMNLKLTTVLGDVTGVTGRKVIRAIRAGEGDPEALAKRRDRRCRHPEPAIAQALDGRYRPEHLCELKGCLAMGEAYQAVIADLDGTIADQVRVMRRDSPLPPLPPKPRVRGRKPHDPRFDVRPALYYVGGVDLTASEGIDEIHARTPGSELGTDSTRWPTAKHFASGPGVCPNGKPTGGTVKDSQARPGKDRAAGARRRAAGALVRSHSYLGAYLRRQRARLGAPKAITATAHTRARIVYHRMRSGRAYGKREADAYAARVRDRRETRLRRRAKELGFEGVRATPAAGEPVPG